MIRSNLKNKYPRCHYNKSKKAKQAFDSEESALEYLIKRNLKNYIVYQCKYCNQYHIGH